MMDTKSRKHKSRKYKSRKIKCIEDESIESKSLEHTAKGHDHHKSLHMKKLIPMLLTIVLGLVFILPVIMTFGGAVYYDGRLTLDGFIELLFNCFPFYRYFWNSTIYTVLITMFGVIISSLAAFGFKFGKFHGKNILYLCYLVLMMMPLQVMILPNYIGLRELGILNTPLAIILPSIFMPLGVVVIHQYMREMDKDIVEAARLDTNSILRIIISVVMPEIKVCILAVGLLVFAESWNMVEQPMLYVNEDKFRMLSTFIMNNEMYSKEVWLPSSVMFIIPVIFCYCYFHRELKYGLKV